MPRTPRTTGRDPSRFAALGIGAVLITGASSGLGAALAETMATPGRTLHLGGRDAGRLEAVAALCAARGARVLPRTIGVTEAQAMADWIGGIGRLDLAIANAGISGGLGRDGIEAGAQARAVFETNLLGALNTLLPAAALMREQTPGPNGLRGRLVAIASIAAFLPAPVAPSYGASKAALDAWVLGNVPAWRRQGIVAQSVCPGFIRSPMTARNRFPMPGLMNADRAAEIVCEAIAKGRPRAVFPGWMGALARGTGLLPPGVQGRVMGRGSK